MNPLRILQLCNKPPLPAIDGGCLAMLRMSEGLLDAGHEVRILAIATDKHPWVPEKIDPAFREKTKMDALYVNTSVRWLPAFLALFKTSSYNVERFHTFGFEARIIEILARNKFDIVQLESLYMCPYIPVIRRMSNAKIILRAHNTESLIWRKHADDEQDAFRKLWFRDLAQKLERYELKAINEVDAIVPITRDDEKRFRAMGTSRPMHTATFAMKFTGTNYTKKGIGNTVFHIGAMDWKPNHDGIEWLVKTVWPMVLQQVPGAELHLAGKGMNKTEFEGKPQVIVYGEVDDAVSFLSSHDVMAVPLFSGGGIKVKMVEGMFAGKPIVTTAVGAEGIEGANRKDFVLAENAGQFAAAIVELLQNKSLADEIGRHARKTAEENHNLSRVTEKLCDFYRSIPKQ